MAKLNSFPSWETLANAAWIRKFETILKILEEEKLYILPDIWFHRRYRSIITVKKIYNVLKRELLYLWRQLPIIFFRRKKKQTPTRLLLHAHDASLNYRDITIHTPDTDVFILAITMWVIETRFVIKTGKQNNLRLIDVENVVNGIDYKYKGCVCEALLGLHALTGCDTTSAFHGHGKVKALQVISETWFCGDF